MSDTTTRFTTCGVMDCDLAHAHPGPHAWQHEYRDQLRDEVARLRAQLDGRPISGDLSEWPNKRPSEWTDEEREHVRQLVYGGTQLDASADQPSTDPTCEHGVPEGLACRFCRADQPNTERCPAGICVREAGHAGPHTDDPRLAISADQPNTGERCPRCDGEGTDPYFDGACQGVAHQLDVSAVSGTAAQVDGDLVDRLREHADRVAGGGPGDVTYDPETLALEHEAADEIERLRELTAGEDFLIDAQADVIAGLQADLERLRAAIRGLLRTGTGLSDYQAAAKRAREVLGNE